MTIHKFSILFQIKKQKVNKDGVVPVYCRITHNSKRKEFETGLMVKPKCWNPKTSRAIEPYDSGILNSH